MCRFSVNNNSPMQDYVHLDNQTQPTFEMTPGIKPFTMKFKFSIDIFILGFLPIRFAQVFAGQEIVDMGKYVCLYDFICICRKLSLLSERKLQPLPRALPRQDKVPAIVNCGFFSYSNFI